MSGYEWYKTGTVIVRNGDKEVVGSGTEWLANDIKTGDIFITENQIYEISDVTGNTSLLLAKEYSGISNGKAEYAIITRAAEVLQADIALKLQQAVTQWNGLDKIINTLKERTDFLEGLAFYRDEDGDLAQGISGSASASSLTSLPIATATRLGGVKIGRNIDAQEDGTISVDVDKQLIQESLDKVAATPDDVGEMINEVYSDNSGS